MEGSSRSSSCGLPDEGPADGQHLLLSSGEGAGRLLAPLAQDGEQLVDVGDVVVELAAPILAPGTAHHQVVLHRQLAEEPPAFRHLAQPAGGDLVRGKPGDIGALVGDVSGSWRGAARTRCEEACVLPAPLAPSTATTSPFGTTKETPWSASMEP